MVTLRGDRMYEFFIAGQRQRRASATSRVLDRSFDGRGNYSLGIREQIIFPEIDLDKVDKVKGLTISICTTARTDGDAKMLLRALGFPFRN